ncbi:cytochrome P450 [Durotheca rogersii]|uniref:cytochrome P450 n=1 Tax=Durotheca rogersii TaxID=419775 RepID=UPI00221FA0E0|nr:cytochrome P450 [Durotheca rogersii]KAI5860307.1 cytochrome P450 [Durotheca rogersii]
MAVSMPPITGAVAAAVVTIMVFLSYGLRRVGRRPKGFPPGPPTLPLIGNIHQIPSERPHLQFQKWAQEYGPIYSLILGTRVVVVLSSDAAVKDLLDKRSNIYSSREGFYLARVLSGGYRMVLMEYGETWRMVRKLVHNSLNIVSSRAYVPYQDLENKAMLLGFLKDPSQFFGHIRRYTNSLSTQMLFGFRTTRNDDPKLLQLYHGFDKFSEAAASQPAAMLDIFPILRHLPDALVPMKRRAREFHRQELDLYKGHYLETRRKIRQGIAKPCFCVDLVRAQEEQHFSDDIACYVSGTLLEAGSDTTAATLIGFVQAMVIFPEVSKAAQAEIDRVCGDRLPDLNDVPDLPYIRGCVKESLRWMPTAIMGIPHAVTRDDEYMGYKIPKGAEVMYNVWAIHNDPKRHPDPRRFDPTRWANDSQTSQEAATNPDVSKRDHFTFGAGRRLCQGMHIADRSLFLAISRLLWAFDFGKAVDKTSGKEITPDTNALSRGMLVTPEPFEANIKPRSARKADQIREEWRKATALLDREMQWENVPEGLIWRDYEPAEHAAAR